MSRNLTGSQKLLNEDRADSGTCKALHVAVLCADVSALLMRLLAGNSVEVLKFY